MRKLKIAGVWLLQTLMGCAVPKREWAQTEWSQGVSSIGASSQTGPTAAKKQMIAKAIIDHSANRKRLSG